MELPANVLVEKNQEAESKLVEQGKKLLSDLCIEYKDNDDGEYMQQGMEGEKTHALATLKQVEQICVVMDRKASDALKLAAIFHDVDRIVNKEKAGGFKGTRGTPEYIAHKKEHAKRSADFICQRLTQITSDRTIIDRVCYLISHHDDDNLDGTETADDFELKCLITADVLDLFNNVIIKLYAAEGENRTKDKIRFMLKKVPESMRMLIKKLHLENPIFEKMKNEVLEELYTEK